MYIYLNENDYARPKAGKYKIRNSIDSSNYEFLISKEDALFCQNCTYHVEE